MILILKIVLLATAVSVASIGVIVGLVYVVAPVTFQDTQCRKSQDISNARVTITDDSMIVTWSPPDNKEYCTGVQYELNVLDANSTSVFNATTTDEEFVFEQSDFEDYDLCGNFVVTVVGIVDFDSMTNPISITIDTGTDCDGTGT